MRYQLYPGLPRLSSPLWLGPSYMLPRSSFVCVHAESFYFKAPPAACDNARKVDDKAHLHCELMYHDYVTLCGRRRCALPPRPPPRLFILEPPPAACDKMQVYDTAHLLFQACVIKLVVKIQVRALLPCCDKTTKVDDMAHQLLRLVLRYRCML